MKLEDQYKFETQDVFVKTNGQLNSKYRNLVADDKTRVFNLAFPDDWELTDLPFIDAGEDTDQLEVAAFHTTAWAKTGQIEYDESGQPVKKKNKKTNKDEEVPVINQVNTQVWRLINTATKVPNKFQKNKRRGIASIAKSMQKGKKAALSDSEEE